MKKQCVKCKKWKPYSEFYKSKDHKDGFGSYCKKCIKIYYHINKIKILECHKKHRQTFIGHLRSRFQLIKQRCVNPNNPKYKDYGGRGIKCLFKSSDEFIDYVLNKLQVNPRGLQIDRINNDGNYEKGNI